MDYTFNSFKVFLEGVRNVFDASEKEKYVDEVWDMIQRAYKKIDGIQGSGFRSKEDMIKSIPHWRIITRPGIGITAVVLYKIKGGMRKGVAAATNFTAQGKRDLAQIVQGDLMNYKGTNQAIKEVSGPMLSFIVRNEKNFSFDLMDVVVPFELVQKIKKDIQPVPPDDPHLSKYPQLADFFYQREIGGKMHTKIMLGVDLISKNFR